jgi:hypothetical protein
MSTEALNRCKRIKQEILDYEPVESLHVYPIVRSSIQQAKQFMGLWFDVYQEYGNQFQEELINTKNIDQSTANQITNLISTWVTSGQVRFGNIMRAKIPSECYLLVQEFYALFHREDKFVLQEDRGFSSNPMIDDFQEELRKMPLPLAADESTVNPIVLNMKNQPVTKITYDATEYNSAQSWLVMLHEVGHQLYSGNNLQSVNPFRTETKMVEVFVDLLVENIFGPSYALALAAYHRNYPVGGITHPVEPARLYALVEGCSSILDRANKNQEYSKSVEVADKGLAKYWLRSKNQLVNEQTEIKRKFGSINKAVLKYLPTMGIKTFDEFCSRYEQSPSRNDPPFEQIEKMIEEEVPVAVDPRILYAAISEFKPITPLLVRESLKRWYVRQNWKNLSSQQNKP